MPSLRKTGEPQRFDRGPIVSEISAREGDGARVRDSQSADERWTRDVPRVSTVLAAVGIVVLQDTSDGPGSSVEGNTGDGGKQAYHRVDLFQSGRWGLVASNRYFPADRNRAPRGRGRNSTFRGAAGCVRDRVSPG